MIALKDIVGPSIVEQVRDIVECIADQEQVSGIHTQDFRKVGTLELEFVGSHS